MVMWSNSITTQERRHASTQERAPAIFRKRACAGTQAAQQLSILRKINDILFILWRGCMSQVLGMWLAGSRIRYQS